ncbi:hypothetical protein B0J14DRAFT_495487 [Halenospora varia]|nr:hypothetical protein B0J14DRAFT_495487 [Halenospora varia]
MPRPKRLKVAPSAPTQRNRSTLQVSITSNAISNAPKPAFDDMYDVSDPEDRGATSARLAGSARKGKTMETPVKRVGSASKPKPSGKKSNHEEDEELRADEDLDLADNIEDGSSPEVEVGRREKSTPGMDNSVFGFGNFRRRARQRSILGRGPGRARSSSVESNLADDNGLTSVGRKNTSSLAAGKFQRRPQQQSVMGRNDTGVAPSSMPLEMTRGTPAVGSALKLANFKRRPRQSSILGTARKPRNYQSDMGEDDDHEDDFNPDDESTPLNLSDGEVDTSGLASDDDELSHLNVRGRRHRSVLSRTPAPARKAPKAKAPPKAAGKTVPRTYGARANATSDKENEELDPDDSLAPLQDDGNESPENSQELENRVGKELKKAARKFQEVDKWELEFEDVTPDTSSPANEGR